MSPVEPLRKVMTALDGWQRRTRWAGVPYAVAKKFGDDNANLMVVALAWYGFTAIFPLLLVVVTLFGFIGAQSIGTGIVSTLHEFPVIGSSFNPAGGSELHGSALGLVVGLIGLLYGAQGVTQTAQDAMAMVWHVPQVQRTGFLPRLGRSLAGLFTIGGGFVINAFVTGYATGGTANYAIRIPVLACLLVLNAGLYFATFTLLTAKVIGPRGLLPGAIAGAIAFTALITIGTGLIAHQLKHSHATYGAFGAVIGIVAFLLLLAKLSLYAAELNPVLARRLYPRALPLGGEPTDADRQVLAALVHAEQRRDDEAIGVGFGDHAAAQAASDAARHAREDSQAGLPSQREAGQAGWQDPPGLRPGLRVGGRACCHARRGKRGQGLHDPRGGPVEYREDLVAGAPPRVVPAGERLDSRLPNLRRGQGEHAGYGVRLIAGFPERVVHRVDRPAELRVCALRRARPDQRAHQADGVRSARRGGAGRQAGREDVLTALFLGCPPAVLRPSGRYVRPRRLEQGKHSFEDRVLNVER